MRARSWLNRKIADWIDGVVEFQSIIILLRGGAIGNTPPFGGGVSGSNPGPAAIKITHLRMGDFYVPPGLLEYVRE